MNILRGVFISLISFCFGLLCFLVENSFWGCLQWMFVLRGLRPDAQSVLAKIQMLCQQESQKKETPSEKGLMYQRWLLSPKSEPINSHTEVILGRVLLFAACLLVREQAAAR